MVKDILSNSLSIGYLIPKLFIAKIWPVTAESSVRKSNSVSVRILTIPNQGFLSKQQQRRVRSRHIQFRNLLLLINQFATFENVFIRESSVA